MYKEYFLEEEKKYTIDKPHGFMTYRFVGDECLICDIYIRPQFRKKGRSYGFLEDITKIANKANSKYLSCWFFLHPGEERQYTRKIRLMIDAGFRIVSVIDKQIIMAKNLRGN